MCEVEVEGSELACAPSQWDLWLNPRKCSKLLLVKMQFGAYFFAYVNVRSLK